MASPGILEEVYRKTGATMRNRIRRHRCDLLVQMANTSSPSDHRSISTDMSGYLRGRRLLAVASRRLEPISSA